LTLGERLKQAREEKRFTQVEVARKLGISNGAISGYERNYRDPDTETLTKLAELYEVDVDYLLGISDVKNRVVYGSAKLEGEGGLKASFTKDPGNDYIAGEHEFIKKARKLAEEHGMELTDPKFLNMLEAAFDFAKRITQNKQE